MLFSSSLDPGSAGKVCLSWCFVLNPQRAGYCAPPKGTNSAAPTNSLPTRAPARTTNLADHPHPSLGAGRAAGCLLTCSKPSTLYGPAVKTPFRRPFALPASLHPPHVLMIASHAGKRALDARPCWLPCTTKSRKTSASTCTSAATRASCGELTKLKSKPQRLQRYEQLLQSEPPVAPPTGTPAIAADVAAATAARASKDTSAFAEKASALVAKAKPRSRSSKPKPKTKSRGGQKRPRAASAPTEAQRKKWREAGRRRRQQRN